MAQKLLSAALELLVCGASVDPAQLAAELAQVAGMFEFILYSVCELLPGGCNFFLCSVFELHSTQIRLTCARYPVPLLGRGHGRGARRPPHPAHPGPGTAQRFGRMPAPFRCLHARHRGLGFEVAFGGPTPSADPAEMGCHPRRV